MSQVGVNMAVTEDGAAYNKLRRPDDYLQSLTAQYPAKSELPPAKRKFGAVETATHEEDGEPSTKRWREEHAPKSGATSGRALGGDTRRVFRPNKENGMQTMFPGLDDDSASDADDTTRDALAYLRSVRSEASTIPTLLVAPPQAPREHERDRSVYNDGDGDHSVIFHDGTWIAVDDDAEGGYYDEEDEWSSYEDDIDPQAAYYQSLLARYKGLRNTLANADPNELVALKKADPEKYANVRIPYYKSDWRYAFDNKYPTPALLAQLDDKSLYRALEYVAEVLITEDTLSKQKSCWIWTLLALAGDSGTLDYYKVGRLRELGHKAGQLSIRLRRGERRVAHGDEEEEGAGDWDVEGDGDDGEDERYENETGQRSSGQENVLAPNEPRQDVEDGEVDEDEEAYEPPTDIGGQSDGATERKHTDDNMSMSEDEGEIQDDDPDEDAPANLEAARARLLAQLGDNLVTETIPDRKIPAHQLRDKKQAHQEPRKGGRHRHNGKVCKDQSCRMNKGRQEAHRKAALRAAQGGKTNGSVTATSSPTSQSPRAAAAVGQQRQVALPEAASASASADASEVADPGALANVLKETEQLDRAALLASLNRTLAGGSIVLKESLATERMDPATFLASLLQALRQAAPPRLHEEVIRQLPSQLAAAARSFLAATEEDLLRQLRPGIAAEPGLYVRRVDGVDDMSETQGVDAERDPGSGLEKEEQCEDEVDLNTRVTIDMILTVVGECYGQRDLLSFREVW